MDDYGKILKAAHFAAEKHSGQRRKDEAQTPYINHPIAVANLLRIFGVEDVDVLVAAILHDVLEDTDASPGEIFEGFGEGVLSIVQEMTDDKSLPKQVRKDLQIEEASSLSEHARWVKLADKICNLEDMSKSPPVDWSRERCVQYVDWCEAVIAGFRGTHIGLENRFDEMCKAARISFDVK
jgi:GTP diphosphokinase / guanosine-3',5'-bis(diphosphate) 3'-diphosphatase